MRQRVETQTAARRVPSPTPAEAPAGQLPMATPMPKQELKPVPVRDEPVKMYPMKIAKAILAVTRKMQPVEKRGVNTFHKYSYPKWEDILEELGPLIAENGLIIIQSEIAHGGFERDLIEISYEFTIVNEDGDVWPDRPTITSICKVRDAKGVLDDKAASKCHTQAHKYAMVQLFKIRTADMVEHDAGGEVQTQQPTRRPVPSPSGKVAPHYIQGVKGETAESWSKKFINFVEKAEAPEEIEAWDEQNGQLLDLCQEKDVNSYNKCVDAMQARLAQLRPKADPISTGKPAAAASDFPGDKKMPPADDLEIPQSLRRTAPKKPTMADVSDDDRDWLLGLGGAFTGAEDLRSLAEEQARLMTPYKDKVSAAAWTLASDLLDEHIERIQNGEQ